MINATRCPAITADAERLYAAAEMLSHHRTDGYADPARLTPMAVRRVYRAALGYAARITGYGGDRAGALSVWTRWYACGALAQTVTGYHGAYSTHLRTGKREHSPHTDTLRLLHYIAAEAAGLHRSLILIAAGVSEDVYVERVNGYAAEHGMPIRLAVRPPVALCDSPR